MYVVSSLAHFLLWFFDFQWRSPEEYYDARLNEKTDIFSLGNNFYTILTGVYPFYEERNEKEVQVCTTECTGFVITVWPISLDFLILGTHQGR